MFKRPASHPARVVVLAMVVFSMVLSLVPVPAQADVTQDQLASHVVTGLDPANTTVNLFNYHTGMTGTGVTAGTDTLGTTGAATPLQNYQTWLANNTGINYGHLLTFGDGMRHLGYWNQGIVESYGDVARTSAGMQGIVEPALSAAGYPVVSDSDEDGLDVNTATYSDLTGGNTWTPNQSFYGNAGPLYISNLRDTATNPLFHPVWGRNVDRVVQAQALAVAGGQPNVDFSALNNNANPSTQATKTALEASSVVDFTDDGGYGLRLAGERALAAVPVRPERGPRRQGVVQKRHRPLPDGRPRLLLLQHARELRRVRIQPHGRQCRPLHALRRAGRPAHRRH